MVAWQNIRYVSELPKKSGFRLKTMHRHRNRRTQTSLLLCCYVGWDEPHVDTLVNYVVEHTRDWKPITSKSNWCLDSSSSAKQGQTGVSGDCWCQALCGLLLLCTDVCVCVFEFGRPAVEHTGGYVVRTTCALTCSRYCFTGKGQSEMGQQDSGSLQTFWLRTHLWWTHVHTHTHTQITQTYQSI